MSAHDVSWRMLQQREERVDRTLSVLLIAALALASWFAYANYLEWAQPSRVSSCASIAGRTLVSEMRFKDGSVECRYHFNVGANERRKVK